jgi:SAM-dependent methyltransferase
MKLDPRRLLAAPKVYNSFQRIVGADRSRRQFIDDHVSDMAGGRVLEIGCGPGTNYPLMPAAVEYVGTDLDPSYIEHARKTYGDSAQFWECGVSELADLDLGLFDAIIAMNLLHHLDDQEILGLCDGLKPLLTIQGRFITCDPCFVVQQGKIERMITSWDRGRFVRFPDQYAQLLSRQFGAVSSKTLPGGSRIPNTGVVMVASVA